MKKIIFLLFVLIGTIISTSAQTTYILDDFENGLVNFTTTVNVNPVDNMLQTVVDNPVIAGLNTSTKVWKWARQDAATDQQWAGFWANLVTSIPAGYTSIEVKFLRTNATSQLRIKCAGTITKEFSSVNTATKTNEWETIVFDLIGNGIQNITQISLFPDYYTPIDVAAISYIDEIKIVYDPVAALPVKTAQWRFDDVANLVKATVGTDLELVGSAPVAAGPSFGNGAVQMAVGSYFKATHGIAKNGGGNYVNQYTFIYDVYMPTASWKALFQTSKTNSNDAECFIKPTGELGIGATGYTATQLAISQWYRIAVAVSLGTSFKYYVNGTMVKTGTSQAIDGGFALELDKVLLFADNDGDDGTIIVSEINMWNKALSDADILALGGVPVVSNTVLMDFGDPGASNISTSPWNNVSNELTTKAATALYDNIGNTTGYSLTTTSNFQLGYNTGGTTAPAGDATALGFPATATKDNFYIGINWGTPTANILLARFDISGLDPSKYYSFSIFGSRAGVGDIRSALYTITGNASTGTKTATLNTSNNTSNVASIVDIMPTAAGVISFSMAPNTDNNNGNKFAYLGAIKMVRSDAPTVSTGLINKTQNDLNGVYYNNGYLRLNDYTGMVKVYSVDGKLIKEANAIFGYLTLPLAKGVYVVKTTIGAAKLSVN